MKKENKTECNEEMDYLRHYLVEQINRITVEEQEEQMREEMENKEQL
ncbi:hypothetical protein [Pseudalkalibacillus caeni]|nr:hypothetical protein [Pseudalkalibacillus caeni]